MLFWNTETLAMLCSFLVIQNVTKVEKIVKDKMLISCSLSDVDQSLYYLIDSSRQRMMVMDNLDELAVEKIRTMRPIPNNFVIIGNKTTITPLLLKVISALKKF